MTPTPDPIIAELAEHVRALGVTETARRMGVSQPEVSRWLSGARSPRLDQLRAMAAAAGVQIDLRLRRA